MTRHPAPFVHMAREVEDALVRGRPVVALETTLVSHGFPHPVGVETAQASEPTLKITIALANTRRVPNRSDKNPDAGIRSATVSM